MPKAAHALILDALTSVAQLSVSSSAAHDVAEKKKDESTASAVVSDTLEALTCVNTGEPGNSEPLADGNKSAGEALAARSSFVKVARSSFAKEATNTSAL